MLENKQIDICVFQETKSGELDFFEGNFHFVTMKKDQWQLGLGFAVRSNLMILETEKITDRLAYITISKNKGQGKRSNLTILNCHAPHMGITMKQPQTTDEFYKKLKECWSKLRTRDLIIAGDFNAKLGSHEFKAGPVGSHARGIRNTNGDHLFEFLDSSNYIASNTFFKHRACHITTWQGEVNKKRVYNQIDYILLPFHRKQSMINARSYHSFKVDTDHRLVVTTLFRKNDYERSKLSSSVSNVDPVIKETKSKLTMVRQKLYQSSNDDNTEALKKQRTRLKNLIKKREAFFIEKTMICEAKSRP